jgi:N-acetylmuramic acid 6-phosphate etherase
MKAGTAQKIALSLLSTAIMIRLGRVYESLMVDMRVSNRKLHARAISIVAEISGADRSEAESALDVAGSNIKLAVLLASGMKQDEAEDLLAGSGDDLRAALNAWRSR